jgi:hypothetical protein
MSLPYHALLVDEFYAELLAGRLHGVASRPALTRDAHELYRLWCDRRGAPGLAGPGHFANALQERHGVPVLRKRYAIGSQLFGPHGVLYLSSPPSPRPGFEYEWLGAHVSAFRAGVSSYRAVLGSRVSA